jgi:hypothetical protein
MATDLGEYHHQILESRNWHDRRHQRTNNQESFAPCI